MHGWGGSIASFKGLADRLSSEYRVTLVDLYGFGDTPHPDHPLKIEDYAEGVREIIRAAGEDEVILVAHSFGGRVALRLAANDPSISGLVLIDAAGMRPRRGIRYYLRVWSYKLGKRLGVKRLPQGSADYLALRGAMRKTFVNVVNEHSEKDAEKVTVPTLLLWGSEDKDTPPYMCRRLHRLIPSSEVVMIKGASHFSYLERPDYTCRVVRAFLRSL